MLAEQDGRPGWLVQHAALLQMREDTSHHRGGKQDFFFPQKHHQLVFAPARVLAPQRQEAFGHHSGPSGLAYPMRAMGTPFQGARIVAIKTPPPAIEGLPADAEMPTGPRRIPPVEVVKQHPLQTALCRLAQLLPEARQLASLGKVTPSNLAHPDTLPSVTHHSERAQKAVMSSFFTEAVVAKPGLGDSRIAKGIGEEKR